eukprot:symbB.v1.2.012499.t1/scaffold862.1/size157115/8
MSSTKRQKLVEDGTIPVKHPDIDKYVEAMSATKAYSRSAACKKLRDIADLENQPTFLVEAGAPAAALKLLGVSRVASAHSCQLLEVLAKLPEVRQTCADHPGITKLLMEVMTDAWVEQSARSSAAGLLAMLLFTLPRLAASSAFLIHPAIATMRAAAFPQSREYATKMLASLAAVQSLAVPIIDSGVVSDLSAGLSGPEQRWAALALYQLARGEKSRHAVSSDGKVLSGLVRLLRESADTAALASAAETLFLLAEDPAQRLQLRKEAKVFLSALTEDADQSVFQEAAAKTLLQLLKQNPGDTPQSGYDEDFAAVLALEAQHAKMAVSSGEALLQRLQDLAKTESKSALRVEPDGSKEPILVFADIWHQFQVFGCFH